MKKIVLLFLLAIFSCGCSTTYTVRSTAAEDAYSYEQMNEKLKGQDATIELRDGRKMYNYEVKIADDSISLIEDWTYKKFKLSIGQFDKIILKNHLIGALEGGGFCLPLGGVASGLVYLMIGDSLGAILVLLFGTPAGILLGLIIGGIIGHSYNYEFPKEQPRDSLRK